MNIISVGKKLAPELKDAVLSYSQRLQGAWRVEWVFVPNSSDSKALARSNESKAVMSRLKPDDFVILLDERGKNISSPALSELLSTHLGRNLIFVIGGAYGVDDTLRQRADFVWSLSNLVLPHQLVRLVLVEQIYRAQSIAQGHPYHHQ